MVNSAIFIFVAKPFDVGDVVRIGSDTRLMTVARYSINVIIADPALRLIVY